MHGLHMSLEIILVSKGFVTFGTFQLEPFMKTFHMRSEPMSLSERFVTFWTIQFDSIVDSPHMGV